jgi:hypothetical protein
MGRSGKMQIAVMPCVGRLIVIMNMTVGCLTIMVMMSVLMLAMIVVVFMGMTRAMRTLMGIFVIMMVVFRCIMRMALFLYFLLFLMDE